MRQIGLTLLASATALLCSSAGATVNKPKLARLSPIEPGAYVVTLKDGSGLDAQTLVSQVLRGTAVKPQHVYRHAFKGFAAKLSPAALLVVKRHPLVKSVQADRWMGIQAAGEQTTGLPWGLDRSDQREKLGYASRLAPEGQGQYAYSNQGEGVLAYVIDTGVIPTHDEFQTNGVSRVLEGAGFVPDGLGTRDCGGHGSHVAGTIGGNTVGVAKGVNIIPVRVLSCAGTGLTSWIAAGIDWAMGDFQQRQAADPKVRAVANLSLGGGGNNLTDDAVAALVNAGVVTAVAAGNDADDACNYSPARERKAITVGATTVTDGLASFSNFGPCVDILAPGEDIQSVATGADGLQGWALDLVIADNPQVTPPVPFVGNSNRTSLSGTSMASPHVAGWAALLLAQNPSLTPDQVLHAMQVNATTGAIADIKGSADRTMFVGNLQPAQVGRRVAVKALSGVGATVSGGWTATVKVSLKDTGTSGSLAGLEVRGYFSEGSSATCTTDSRGQCQIVSSPLSASSTRFLVNAVYQAPGAGVNQAPTVLYDMALDAANGLEIAQPR